MSCPVHPSRTGGEVKTIGFLLGPGETHEARYAEWATRRGERCRCLALSEWLKRATPLHASVTLGLLLALACARCDGRVRETHAHGAFAALCFECTTDFMNSPAAAAVFPVDYDLTQDPSAATEMHVALDRWLEGGMT